MNITSQEQVVDIMIDLETLGTKPGCTILAIGAYAFTVAPFENFGSEKETKFSTTISRFGCKQYGLTEDPATLEWWNKQDSIARAETFTERSGLIDTLCKFQEFLWQFKTRRVWGNSAAFDLGILAAAYEITGLAVPWYYREECCYRTMKNIFPSIPYIPPTVPHIALNDAIAEANHLRAIMIHCV